MNSSNRKCVSRHAMRLFLTTSFATILLFVLSARAKAQALGWEGETGVFVTPLAYTANVEGQRFHAVTAYHYLHAGPVIGDFHELSLEVGAYKRFEFGYTRDFHVYGNTPGLSYLWGGGFDIFNAKATVIPETFKKQAWIPQISVGTILRFDDRNVGDYLYSLPLSSGGVYTNGKLNNGRHNQDVYLVGSKLISKFGQYTSPIPILLTGGIRGTNSELWGMGGNAPDWDTRAFGSAAFVVKLPEKMSVVFAAEAAQQPHHPLGYTSANDAGGVKLNIPTTLTYAARFVPSPNIPLNLDLGVAQIGGRASGTDADPGVNLKARHQIGVQMSYNF